LDKTAWTLARAVGVDDDELRDTVLLQLPASIGELVPAVESLTVTMQQPDEYCGALVPVAAQERPADVLVEVTTCEHHVALDPLREWLGQRFAHVQGWRVKPTVIWDASTVPPLGQPSEQAAIVCFVERLDGTTPEHFDHNWFVHAGHADGQEPASTVSIAERTREEEAMPGGRYVQNRVVEPVTPTAWLVHGYTQLFFPMHLPPVEGTDPYSRVRGEEPFDRWPPRILQGHEYRLR
jgi:hypothetical protein